MFLIPPVFLYKIPVKSARGERQDSGIWKVIQASAGIQKSVNRRRNKIIKGSRMG
jgi:hypothetical protein